MRNLILFIAASVLFPLAAVGQNLEGRASMYVLPPMIDLRNGPGKEHDVASVLGRNNSIVCLAQERGWVRVATVGGRSGWTRRDFVSDIVVALFKNDRLLTVKGGGKTLLSVPVSPGKRGLGEGRYFGVPQAGRLMLSWPNRKDLRDFLAAGQMGYATYARVLVDGPESVGGTGLALCSGNAGGEACGAILSAPDFDRLEALVSKGARVEIYGGSASAREINRPDELSQRIHQGALGQLKRPAAGISPDSRVPSISYPGGDIQPDFATSADIVTRAVRHAGVDLQAVIHEDILLYPERYADLGRGKDGSGPHRHVPTLCRFLEHNALSLPLDIRENPFAFEAGDIVLFATGLDGEGVPDRAGVVGETFNNLGHPLVITVWDMGQSTGLQDIFGRKNLEVVGHFRMTHLFDYQ